MTFQPQASAAGSRLRGRRRKGQQTGREALLCAAALSFAKSGYEGTALRVVAAEAGVDVALVGRLFGSKADLWLAVIERLVEHQAGYLRELGIAAELAIEDPAAGMCSLIEIAAQVSYEAPTFPAFLMQEAGTPGQRLDIIQRRLVRPFSAASEPIVARAKAAGAIRSTDCGLFVGMLMAAISMAMCSFPFAIGQEEQADEARRDRIAREAIALFVVSPADPSTAQQGHHP